MTGAQDDPVQHVKAVEAELAATNDLLAEWTACAAEESAPLIERLEEMGYEVRGRSHEAVAEALRHPPRRPASG